MALGGWLVAALAAMLAVAAWRAQTMRMDAVARACHELRGPLTAARLGLQLGARVGELSSGRLRAIDVELGRAALALDDLSRAPRGPSRAPARAGSRVPVDVRAVVSDSVEAWAGVASSRGVSLRMGWSGSGAGATVPGDRFRLAQATGNLIANAIEHGGGTVEVSGSVTGGVVRVEVADCGPGLPAPVAVLARGSGRRSWRGKSGRWDRWRRRRRCRRTGRGHGLAVALAVTEAHGGRLAAAPAERGARVVMELPVSSGSASAAGG